VNESPGDLSGFGTMSLPKLKLIYLPVRARAEATRLALAYANIPYEDVTIPFSDWPEFKVCRHTIDKWVSADIVSQCDSINGSWHRTVQKSSQCVHGQLPVLEVDGKVSIPQSGAILRYVAKIANLTPKGVAATAAAPLTFPCNFPTVRLTSA
jgi:hypothetical protein